MKIGLALGSGGARGLAHIGVLKALHEENIEISCIAGSSMGALVGAVYASTQSIDSLLDLSESITWQQLIRLFIPTLSKSGLVDGEKVVELLEKWIPSRHFDALDIPLALEATDIINGTLVTLTEGELLPAIRASISIPIVFTPISINGRTLVDGGLISPVPVETVRNMGADFVIGVNVLAENRSWLSTDKVQKQVQKQNQQRPNILSQIFKPQETVPEKRESRKTNLGPILVLTQTIGVTISKMAEYQLNLQKPELLIEPDTTRINVYDFHRGDAVINDAYKLAKRKIQENRARFNK
jgi:NTE family protein